MFSWIMKTKRGNTEGLITEISNASDVQWNNPAKGIQAPECTKHFPPLQRSVHAMPSQDTELPTIFHVTTSKALWASVVTIKLFHVQKPRSCWTINNATHGACKWLHHLTTICPCELSNFIQLVNKWVRVQWSRRVLFGKPNHSCEQFSPSDTRGKLVDHHLDWPYRRFCTQKGWRTVTIEWERDATPTQFESWSNFFVQLSVCNIFIGARILRADAKFLQADVQGFENITKEVLKLFFVFPNDEWSWWAKTLHTARYCTDITKKPIISMWSCSFSNSDVTVAAAVDKFQQLFFLLPQLPGNVLWIWQNFLARQCIEKL